MIDWQALALIAYIQQELTLQSAESYERLQIFEPRPYWTLPVQKEPVYLPLTEKMTPGYSPTFEVDRVGLKRVAWFCRKQLSNIHDGIYVYAMLLGASSKCKQVVYYLFEPELWELVGRGK